MIGPGRHRKQFKAEEKPSEIKILENKESPYDKNQEPIVISKATSDIFLKEKNPSELMALYWFYYYTAKWQGTNNAKATTFYAAKGLKWGEDKIRRG